MTELDFVLDRCGSLAGPVSAGYGPAGFYVYASNFPYKKKNPNASPTWKIQFGYPYLRKSSIADLTENNVLLYFLSVLGFELQILLTYRQVCFQSPKSHL